MSWGQLKAIVVERAALAADERRRGPVDCPNDGTALRVDADGDLRCPFDGWSPAGPRRRRR